MTPDPIIFRDAVEELLYAHRNPASGRQLSAVAQTALLRALRTGPQADLPGERFLAAADLLRGDARDRGIPPAEVTAWSRPQSEDLRRSLWHLRHRR